MWDGPLASAIAQGDLGAVGAAFDRHGQELYDYCQAQLGDAADAAEVVEATFVVAAAKASLLQNTARLRAWLFAIARCGCQQRLRAGAKPAYLDEIADSDWHRLGGTAWRSDLLSTAWRALAEMSPRDSEVAELSTRHGLDTAELADVLGVPRDQARTLAQGCGDQFEASWDLLLAGCRGRSWYCETAAGYLSSLNGDLTQVAPRRVKEHTAHCEVCTKRERLNPGSAVVLGLLPAVRLAADERKRLLWLLSDSSADVEAYRAGIILRFGPFGPDGYPGRAGSRPVGSRPVGSRAVRPRRAYVVAAGVATLAVALVGAGGFLVDEHFDAQNGLQPAAGRQGPSPQSAQPPKTDASSDAPSPGKHSSSTRPAAAAPTTSSSPQGGALPAASSSPSPRPSSPRPSPSHSSSPPPAPPSPSPSPSPNPASPSPTPSPSPDPTPGPSSEPTPTSSASPTRAHPHWLAHDHGRGRHSSLLRSGRRSRRAGPQAANPSHAR